MSSTNRGSKREQLDQYYTPDGAAEAIIKELPIYAYSTILEPHVGQGAFVKAVKNSNIKCTIFGNDLDPNAEGLKYCDNKYTVDFLEWPESPLINYSWCIGNPPFKGFEKHVEKALSISVNVVFILRLNALGSFDRFEWWNKIVPLPHKIFVLVPRPQFVKSKKRSDSCEYAAFWWNDARDTTASIQLIKWAERKRKK